MSKDMRCGDPAALAGYLYDECDPAEREAIEQHLATCDACEEEVASLRATRVQMAEWIPPDARLGFRVVPDSEVGAAEPEPVAGRWWQWSPAPAWSQAMAAVLLFACGVTVAALMNLEIHYDQAGFTVRTGWQQAAASAATAPTEAQNVTHVSTRDLQALETRIHDEIVRIQASDPGASGTTVPTVANGSPSNELLRRVRALVAESEQKQQRELALRLAQVVRDVDFQRRVDIARLERTVSPMEGVTTQEIQQQRQMLNYLLRVSQTPR